MSEEILNSLHSLAGEARDPGKPIAQIKSWDRPPTPSDPMGTVALRRWGEAEKRRTSPTDWLTTPGWWCCPPGFWNNSGVSSQSSQSASHRSGTWTERELDGMRKKSSRLSLNLQTWWCPHNVSTSDCNHTECPDREAEREPEVGGENKRSYVFIDLSA